MTKNQSVKAMIYPYTELTPREMQSLITAVILYDDVSYLDYDAQCGEPKPIKRKLEYLEPGFKRDDSLKMIDYLERKRVLNPINVNGLLWGFSNSNDDIEQMFCNLVRLNLQELRNLGFDDSFDFNYKLAVQKLYRCVAHVLGVDYDSIHESEYEVEVGFAEGEALLLAYTEFVTKVRNITPFALHRLHADTLEHIYSQRLKQMKGRIKKLEDIYFGELLAAKFDILKSPWDLKPSEIGRIRRNTAGIRSSIHEGISELFQEHVERVGVSNFRALTEVTKDDLTSLGELEEEYRKSVDKSKDLTPAEVITTGVLGLSVGAAVSIGLSAFTGPLALLFMPIVSGVAGKFSETAAQEFMKSETELNPLQNTICFIRKIGEII